MTDMKVSAESRHANDEDDWLGSQQLVPVTRLTTTSILYIQDHDVQLHLPSDGHLGREVPGSLQAAPLQKCEQIVVDIAILKIMRQTT